MFARFEVRQLQLPAARKILGTAIGMCPKEALFKGYIQLEFDVRVVNYESIAQNADFLVQLREFDRVRTLYEKYIEVRVVSLHRDLRYQRVCTVRPHELRCLDQICGTRNPASRLRSSPCDL